MRIGNLIKETHPLRVEINYSDESWEDVVLPHCFNSEDIQSNAPKPGLIGFLGGASGKKGFGYYRGIAWYRKTFNL